ncbi:hypothetical protein QYM36_001389, partial [Artemia franciscana]
MKNRLTYLILLAHLILGMYSARIQAKDAIEDKNNSLSSVSVRILSSKLSRISNNTPTISKDFLTDPDGLLVVLSKKMLVDGSVNNNHTERNDEMRFKSKAIAEELKGESGNMSTATYFPIINSASTMNNQLTKVKSAAKNINISTQALLATVLFVLLK